jgi:hypothetical protein
VALLQPGLTRASVNDYRLLISDQEIEQGYGVQPHHLLLCDALGLD